MAAMHWKGIATCAYACIHLSLLPSIMLSTGRLPAWWALSILYHNTLISNVLVMLAHRTTWHTHISCVFVDKTMKKLCTAFVTVLVRVYIWVSIAALSPSFLDMSNETTSEFAHTMSPTFTQILHGFPPPDDVAPQYGYGKVFEPDYDLLTKAHAHQLTHQVSEDIPPPDITPPFLPLPPTPAIGVPQLHMDPTKPLSTFHTCPTILHLLSCSQSCNQSLCQPLLLLPPMAASMIRSSSLPTRLRLSLTWFIPWTPMEQSTVIRPKHRSMGGGSCETKGVGFLLEELCWDGQAQDGSLNSIPGGKLK